MSATGKLSAILCTSLLVACGMQEENPTQWITVDQEAAQAIMTHFGSEAYMLQETDDLAMLKMSQETIGKVSEFMHDEFHRCGGFLAFEEETSAAHSFDQQASEVPSFSVPSYTMDQQARVNDYITQVKANEIVKTIKAMSTFNNRYFSAQSGVDSQKMIFDRWQEMGDGRADFEVVMHQHSSWSQPTVIGTLLGSESPDEIIIIGGHGDSIAGWWDRANSRAPGADDNASGVATMTETLRVLLASGYQPKRTIKFMSYAAEEVGLKGSQEIAKAYRAQNKNVLAVMQLDMTNYEGDLNTMSLIRDNTSDELTNFTAGLIDSYLDINHVDDRCGYGCSDHASWNGQGYPAVLPFEATVGKMNGKIHTAHDTIENADPTGEHASEFAKLAVAFAVEIAK